MNENATLKSEMERLRVLQEYGLLQLIPQPALDQFTALAPLICHFAFSAICIAGNDQQLVISATAVPGIRETAPDWGFMQLIMEKQLFTEVTDTLENSLTRDNRAVKEAPHIRAFAGFPLIDRNGVVLGAFYVMHTESASLTTQQQQALSIIAGKIVEAIQANRRETEERHFTKLFDLSQGLVSVSDFDGRLCKFNQAHTNLLGWTEANLRAMSILDIVHPDDIADTKKELERMRTGQPTVFYSNRLRTKDGEYKCIQWVAVPEAFTGNIFAMGRDITNEKKKEQALITSENTARTLFENSLGMMSRHDLQGNLTYVNKASADSLGYTAEELAKMNLYQVIPPAYHEGLNEYLRQIRIQGKVTGLMHTQHKNGDIHIWLFNNVLMHDSNGDPYVIGNAADITERHELETDLKRTKELLERTNRVARIGGWEFDLTKNELYWSTVTFEIHEVPPDFQLSPDKAMAFYTGYNRVLLDSVMTEAIMHGTPWRIELQITTAKGRTLWVKSIGHAELEDGICKRLLGTFQDIDNKKKADIEIQRSRQLLQNVLQSASEVSIIATDHEGLITLFNKGAERLLNYSAEELIGKYTWDILHVEEEITARGIELSEQYGQPIEGFQVFAHIPVLEGSERREWTYIRKDSSTIIVSLVVTPIRDNGIITGYLGIAVDITEKKKAERDLKEATLQAEYASKAKSEFLANMSHEIRTPLNGVIGFTDLVLKTTLNETQQQYIAIVNQSANALLSIINDILDFSKIEAGKIELDISKSDIYEFSSQASDILSFQAQQKGLEMLLNVSHELPRFVWADVVRLKQILLNLLANAVKFTEKGEIELKITPVASPAPGVTTIRFEVRDTGIGIHKNKQDKIFEAFLQEDISTTKRYGGTGLGLSISNKLLALMGSRLHLESIPGDGSVFSFEVTFKTEDGAPIAWENIDMVKKVLIVDDNGNNRMILRKMLQLKDISFDEASNGIEALQYLMTKQQYDVILMDYHMPVLDGLETIRKIRENFDTMEKEPAFILLHSSADDDTLIKASEELRVNHRLLKPIKIQEMFHALSHLFIREDPEDNNQVDAETKKIKRNIRILIAEDNPINMLLACTIIKKIAPAARVIEAKNGKEAVDCCEQHLPDMIFMDIQMPIINGYEATAKIREISRHVHIPIIALTAGNVKGEREKCIAAGMDDYITKPFVENTLVTVFEKWLTKKSGS
jgi:PAS domain S-box-containing protein